MIPELPVLPQLKRNFKLLRASTFFKNASSLMRHAAATEGKLAHLLPLDKRESPSQRLETKIYDAAQEKISLSKMTFSHQMIRLIFVEQLYRAMTILNNGPYHHE